MDLISVIIPVYNRKKYLERCIASILLQSYTKLEIILVDDGSYDGSELICDDYGKKYSNIVVIHKSNGGSSSARNAGIKSAKGNYIGFVDSDDWIHINMFERLYQLISMTEADVSYVQYISTTGKVSDKHIKEEITVLENESILIDYLLTENYSMCNKLYRRNRIELQYFDESLTNNEDNLANFKILSRCNKVVKTNLIYYYYFTNPGSITNSPFTKKDLDLIKVGKLLVEYSEPIGSNDIIRLANIKLLRSYFSILAKIACFGYNEPSFNRAEMISYLLSNLKGGEKKLLSSNIPTSRKILIYMFCRNYDLVYKLSFFKRR